MTSADTARQPWAVRVVLATTALVAILAPAIVVSNPPVIRQTPGRLALPRRVVPPAELPPVEPVEFVDLPPAEARAFNAGIPFATGPNPAARPFRFTGSDEDRARAVDCLAAGLVYEAGNDVEGERAVAQVVLNRLRHPAFPKTICGVVFEGQERSTGCQFTFSCDGALTRWTPDTDAWRRARDVAESALAGAVYKPIGYSTHYHTDWVVPYWQSSLDKVAAVHSHLFFRWTGWWGTPPAFRRQVSSAEPFIAQLAALSDAHKTEQAWADAQPGLIEASLALGFTAGTGAMTAAVIDGDSFLVTLPGGTTADLYPALAARACADRPTCRYVGWSDAAKTPSALPLEPSQIASMTFSYLRDRTSGTERTLWNCQQVKRPDRRQCMKQQVLLTAAPSAPATAVTPTPDQVTAAPTILPQPAAPGRAAKPVAELGGVRRARGASPPDVALAAPVRPEGH